jgi:hypothetical protein
MDRFVQVALIGFISFTVSFLLSMFVTFRGKQLFRWLRHRWRKEPIVPLPRFLPILEELGQAWEAVTVADIERTARNMAECAEGERKLGTIHNDGARRTWALVEQMGAKCAEAKLYARARANSEEEGKYYMELAARFDAMQDSLAQLFWAQAKDDVGSAAWDTSFGVGVRSGWMMVALARPAMPAFTELFGGRAR